MLSRFRRTVLILIVAVFGVAVPMVALGESADVPDTIMGEYEGTFTWKGQPDLKAEGRVVNEGEGYYRLNLRAIPTDPEMWPVQVDLYGKQIGPEVTLFGKGMGGDWSGVLRDGKISAGIGYESQFTLTKMPMRKSPTEGLEAPKGAIVLLPYSPGKESDLSQWNNPAWKLLPDGSVEVGQGPLQTKRTFQDYTLHVEFNLPLMPINRTQGRANSGVYLNEHYEIQVLDSFGVVEAAGDCGAIYHLVAPRVNASLPPQTWQTYDIEYRAPRLGDSGDVMHPKELPVVSVRFNGVLIHDHRTISEPTDGFTGGHSARGPIQLQDHGCPIRYRNIWLVENQ